MAKKIKRKEKHEQRLVVSKYLESYFSTKISTIPAYIAKCYSKYSIYAMSLHSKSYFFLLCNSKLMGK
jgi:hypothetical protein